MDSYIAPLTAFSYPLYTDENSFHNPVLKAHARFGFRFEAGLLSEGVALDFRANSRSYYDDYGVMLRWFKCSSYDALITLCPGVGIGGSYSPGMVGDDKGRTFFDFSVNPHLRMIFDTQARFAVMAEAGLTVVPIRDFNTASPVASDGRSKVRAEVAAGLMLDWERIEETSIFGAGVGSGNYHLATVQFGVKGGFPISHLLTYVSGGVSTSSETRNGVLGGVALDIGGPGWGGAFEGLYVSRRFGIDDNTYASLEQIEIPAFVRYRTRTANFLVMEMGGFGSVPISKYQLTIGGTTTTASTENQKLDYGLLGGIGFGAASRIVTILVELRYLWGMTNISLDTSGATSVHSRALEMMLGFLF